MSGKQREKISDFCPHGREHCECMYADVTPGPEGARPDEANPKESIRLFRTGATRDADQTKLDYEGFLSPLVLEEYAKYMHKHRVQLDGELRDSDNWQKGIPFEAYMKSGWRHFMEWWIIHRAKAVDVSEQIDALCGVIFNAMGYLHELLKEEEQSDS